MNHAFASHQTGLPIANVEQANQYAPQYNAVSWAFSMGRKHLKGEPLTATLVLVAYAQHAEASLFSGNGYAYTTLETVAGLVGLSVSTVRTHTKTLVRKGLLNDGSYLSGVRIPEEAFNAEWVKY